MTVSQQAVDVPSEGHSVCKRLHGAPASGIKPRLKVCHKSWCCLSDLQLERAKRYVHITHTLKVQSAVGKTPAGNLLACMVLKGTLLHCKLLWAFHSR